MSNELESNWARAIEGNLDVTIKRQQFDNGR